MQPFLVAEKVKDACRRCIETSFPIQREALHREFDWQEFPRRGRITC